MNNTRRTKKEPMTKTEDAANEEKVLLALENKQYQWRTAPGIAAEVGIPVEDVRKTLRNNAKVVRSSALSDDDRELFIHRDRFAGVVSAANRILGSLKNRAD